MRKLLLVLATIAAFGVKTGGRALADVPVFSAQGNPHFHAFLKTTGAGDGAFHSIAQITVDPQTSYVVDVDVTGERTGGSNTDQDVGVASQMHCPVLYTYVAGTFTAPTNDVSAPDHEGDANENGCQYPIIHLCKSNNCVWNQQPGMNASPANTRPLKFLVTDGKIDIQVQDTPTKNKDLAYFADVTVTAIVPQTGSETARLHRVEKGSKFSASAQTTDSTHTVIAQVEVDPQTSYIVDVALSAVRTGGVSGDTDTLTASYLHCKGLFTFSDGPSAIVSTNDLCGSPRRHLCSGGTCIWNQAPIFEMDGSNISLKVAGQTDKNIAWSAVVSVIPVSAPLETTTTTTTSTTTTTT